MKMKEVRAAILAAGVAIATLLGSASNGLAAEDQYFGSADETLRALTSHAVVDYGSVASPTNRFLLIRTKSHMCAIRFTSFRRDSDQKSPTVFNSGEESFYAEADFYQNRRNTEFSSGNVKLESLALSKRALVGIGRLAFQPGNSVIKCGGTRLWWSFPTWVPMFVEGRVRDEGVEVAPTAWTEMSQINVRDPHIRWYRYDPSRERMLIPLSELPGAKLE